MRWRLELRRRARALFRGHAVDRDLADEMRLHIELETEELMRTEGLPEAEARRRALVAFGGEEQVRAAHREVRGVRWIEQPMEDLRYALRGLRRTPGFTVAVVLTLALGIGANTAMFSVVDRLLFRAPPMLKDAARTHRVYLARMVRGREYAGRGVQYARYVELTRDTRSFSRTAAFAQGRQAVGVGAATREMTIGVASASFWGFFNAPPALGRYFTKAEDTPPTGTDVAVLGYGFWRTEYGGRKEVLGQRVQVGPVTYTIIGVTPEGFTGVWQDSPPAVYVPISAYAGGIWGARGQDWSSTYHLTFSGMLVERRPGVSLTAATTDLNRAYLASWATQRAQESGMESARDAKAHAVVASVIPNRGPNASRVSRVATWIAGVALVVLLIACANVANLLLGRSIQRRREIAVRLAMGVSRRRLAAQLLTESLLLALLGGAAGLAVAQWGGALLRARLLPRAAVATVVHDPRALLAAGLMAGLAPLVQTRRADLTRDLSAGQREGTYQRSRARVVLLLLQGTLSVVLLVGAGLFVRSLLNVRSLPLGYDPDAVALVELNMRGVQLDSARKVALRERLLEKARTVPGVVDAARRSTIPFWSTWSTALYVAGIDSVDLLGEFDLNSVSPDYFATMGTRILRGRGFTDRDVAGAPRVMVVSQAMAGKLWPGADAIGRCVRVDYSTAPCATVVGIAENIRNQGLAADDPGLFYYVSAAQYYSDQGGLAVRVPGDAAKYAETIRLALQPVMPGASYVTVTPLSEVLGQQTQSWELGTTMFIVFGLLALVLAAVGLYSVIAYDVSRRTHELGVRVAFGARMRDLAGLVLSRGLRVAFASIALGVAIALAVGRWIQPLLFRESPRDPVVFVVVAVLLLVVAALASVIPARRAGNVDPMVALRAE